MEFMKNNCMMDNVVSEAQPVSHNVREMGNKTIETTTYQSNDPDAFDKVISGMKHEICEILSGIRGMTIGEIICESQEFSASKKDKYTKVKLHYGEYDINIKINDKNDSERGDK